MFGTGHLLATAELDFIDEYMDVPILVLLDNTRVERVKAGKPVTDEEKKLWHLQRSCRQRSAVDVLWAAAPDVVCYLSEAAIREIAPDFPGWQQVIAAFRRHESRGSRPAFKTWLRDHYAVDLMDGRQDIRGPLHYEGRRSPTGRRADAPGERTGGGRHHLSSSRSAVTRSTTRHRYLSDRWPRDPSA